MSKTINQTAINKAIAAAAKHVEQARSVRTAYLAALDSMAPEFKGVPREDASASLTIAIAKEYGIELREGQRGATFDAEHEKYQSAKKLRTDALARLYGRVSAHKALAVQRFNRQRVEAIQGAIAGMSKDEARAYLKRAYELAFA